MIHQYHITGIQRGTRNRFDSHICATSFERALKLFGDRHGRPVQVLRCIRRKP